MKKVITINLNGNAYQVDEDGYAALRSYLDNAETQLKDNPDKNEILVDLEQAIAEKCAAYLSPQKTVVNAQEIAAVITAMGAVNSDEPTNDSQKPQTRTPKRLYRIQAGAMIGGVCNGIGAYFGIDATLVRVAFVLLGLLSFGIFGMTYLIMMFVVPMAHTPEEIAAAQGLPFNAQDLIDRARQQYQQFKMGAPQRHQWRAQQRAWRRHWRHQWRQVHWAQHAQWHADAPGAAPQFAAAAALSVVLPLLGVISVLAGMAMGLAILSLVTTHAIFGWSLPGSPLWVNIVLVIAVYFAIVGPLRAARHAAYYSTGVYRGWVSAFDGLIGLSLTIVCGWLVYNNVPAVRELLQNGWREITNLNIQ